MEAMREVILRYWLLFLPLHLSTGRAPLRNHESSIVEPLKLLLKEIAAICLLGHLF